MNLNEDQQAAANAVFSFLLDNEREFSISGPAGVGKTFLMKYIMTHVMKLYEDACTLMGIKPEPYTLQLTATTNKAAEVLQKATGYPACTIHSFLKLKVQENYSTGKTQISKTRDWKPLSHIILFVDEASMVDKTLMHYIRETLDETCKIIFLGDHCQMAPVNEKISLVYQQKKNFAELRKPMRNAEQPALVALCSQLRHTVETLQFSPIEEVPGVIEYLDPDKAIDFINSTFTEENPNSRILAFTNARVQEYNSYIRNDLRHYPDKFTAGEVLVNNAMMTIGTSTVLRVEEILYVREADHTIKVDVIDSADPNARLEVYQIEVAKSPMSESIRLKIPVDPSHLKSLKSYYAGQKDWERYFHLKNSYPDLRLKDACTVYKAQGSTYDSVLIDLNNIGKSTDPDQVARMLYVAASRSKNRVYLYGELPPEYRGAA